MVCPNPYKKGFLVPLQEDLAPALMAEMQMEGPFFEPLLDGSGKQSRRKRQQEQCHTSCHLQWEATYKTACVHLMWMSIWSLRSSVCSSIACVEL